MSFQFKCGSHKPGLDMCVMEAASYVVGAPHSDHPECVSPVIAAFMRSWNDGLPSDAERSRLLKPLLPIILHTRTTAADEEKRAWMATDWLARVFLPAFLQLTPSLQEDAKKLHTQPEWTKETAPQNQPALSAADSPALSAADSPALSAALSAARSAALSAARSAAYLAARSAAYLAAYLAARSAAYSALEPVIDLLQRSAHDLVVRMAAVGTMEDCQIIPARLVEVLG